MSRRPPRYTRTDTLIPYTSRFRSTARSTRSAVSCRTTRRPRRSAATSADCSAISVERLVHIQGRSCVARRADLTSRIANHRGMRRNGMQHDAAGANLGSFANLDVPENLRSSADHHAAAHLRVAVAAFLARTAQGNALPDRDVIAQHSGFDPAGRYPGRYGQRSEEHTSELQSLMRISYAVFCLKKKKTHNNTSDTNVRPHTQHLKVT